MTLFQRSVLFSLLVLVTLTVAGTSAFFVSYTQTLQSQLAQHADSTSTVLSRALATPLEVGDQEQLALIASSLLEAPEITQLKVVEKVGGQTYQWFDQRDIDNVPQWLVDSHVLLPITLNGTISNNWVDLATFTLTITPNSAYENLWHQLQQFALLMLLLTLLSGLIYATFMHHQLKPLARINTQLKQAAQLNFVQLEHLPKLKDLRELTESANHMAIQLSRMQQTQSSELESLRQTMMMDAVSTLPNRQYFNHQLESHLSNEEQCIVFLAQLSWLDMLHAKFGYHLRDETWRLLGQALVAMQSNITDACIARLSANEIAIMLPESSTQQARLYLQQLIRTINEEIDQSGLLPNHHFNIGIAVSQHDDVASLLAKADNALQEAKQSNEIYHWADENSADIRSREQWRSLLTTAINSQQVKLYRQPVRSLRSDSNCHNEVYAHMKIDGEWQSAGKLLGRLTLFSLGEDFDRLVLSSLSEHIEQSGDHGMYAVNLTGESVNNTHFVDWLTQILSQSHLHSRIALEVTEQTARASLERCQTIAKIAHKFGCQFGVDHFGRELRGLSYLTELKPDYVKLDQGFSSEHAEDNTLFIQMLINIAGARNIRVIATGIQQEGQLNQFNDVGIDGYQGYINPPVSLCESTVSG